MNAAPLKGIRVLTIDNFEAGNYGPMLLAMHGADVVKLERPAQGDVLRTAGPYTASEHRRRSHGELRLMRAKRSLTLDPRDPEGMSTFRALLGVSDVLWTNLQPASAERLGIDWINVHKLNPRLVFASVTGFGLDMNGSGPHQQEPAFDIVAQALTGMMMRNADQNGMPEYNGLPLVDQVTSLFGAFGVVMGLLQRERTGSGCCIDVAMYDVGVALNEKAVTVYGLTGQVPAPRASATSAPFGAYRSSDGFIAIGVGGNPVWRRFCVAIGRPDLVEDPRLADGSDRVGVASSILRPLVEAWSSTRSTEAAVDVLQAAGVPSAPILDVDDVIVSDQAKVRRIIVDITDGQGNKYRVVNSPVHLSPPDSPVDHEYPHVSGEDTADVLRDWLGREV